MFGATRAVLPPATATSATASKLFFGSMTWPPLIRMSYDGCATAADAAAKRAKRARTITIPSFGTAIILHFRFQWWNSAQVTAGTLRQYLLHYVARHTGQPEGPPLELISRRVWSMPQGTQNGRVQVVDMHWVL